MTGSPTSSRKLDHLRICCTEEVQAGDAGFGDVRLVHDALPECDMDRISTRARFLGHRFGAPLMIAAMTGGHDAATAINERLAAAAERFGLGIGVGSQRAALEDPSLCRSYRVVRETAPSAFVVANLGAVQLRDHGPDWADRAVEMVGADALAIHLNFLQEAIQPEGDHDAAGCLGAIEHLCRSAPYPVIVKETGNGLSGGVARRLYGAGVAAVDTGGLGGTSWAVIEGIRAREGGGPGDSRLAALGETFRDWGIPTVASLIQIARCGGPVIATGGIRSGLDVAKALALGADLTGIALPLLAPAREGQEKLDAAIERVIDELRVAMFLTGSPGVPALKETRAIVTGRIRELTER
ncbi:MAG: type 2 isopentenyl-diphosphate Delta-isomerase [Methanospirillum sp.]|nr:type 2 isopentenyl-diphosphate Delta-isomerase [Methanospirillum sp.]